MTLLRVQWLATTVLTLLDATTAHRESLLCHKYPFLHPCRIRHGSVVVPRPNKPTERLRGGAQSTPTKESYTENKHPHRISDLFGKRQRSSRVAFYSTCLVVVLTWVITGTWVYSYMNQWPLPTAFFYAVDAGMSIGFCTDVAEHTVRSRAFSILFILLGASVVGGALVLLVHDNLEGIISTAITSQYRDLLEHQAFDKNDHDGDGKLTYGEFHTLLRQSAGHDLTEEQFSRLCDHLDPDRTGFIVYHKIVGSFRCIDDWIGRNSSSTTTGRPVPLLDRIQQTLETLRRNVDIGPSLLYMVCFLWVAMGVTWGVLNQHWDVITSTHFAVSALATGGLTAPPVNEEGFLPSGVAIFVGIYCLFGIPLFLVTMGHFATTLVASHLVEAEKRIIATPMQPFEYHMAKSLCTRDDVVHLSDFIVLYFLRRGKTNIETIHWLREQFEEFDSDGSGFLTYEEATSKIVSSITKSSSQHQN